MKKKGPYLSGEEQEERLWVISVTAPESQSLCPMAVT